MSSLSATLNIAKNALAAQQYSLGVTGHNIANVDNPNYSKQTAIHQNITPSSVTGSLIGQGVDVDKVQQSVNKLLLNQMADGNSSLSSYKETASYMKIIESYFNTNSENSINSLLSEFWNSWHDLSDNPLSIPERVSVVEKGTNLSQVLSSAGENLEELEYNITKDIETSVKRINDIAKEIVALNNEIVEIEAQKSANDQRDIRNTLVSELSTLINIDTYEMADGSISVNVGNGSTLVYRQDTYNISMVAGKIIWNNSLSFKEDISNKISGGKIKGWLEMRDEIIPKYTSELDVLAKELIWNINYQHSKGAGLEYFSDPVQGTYATDHTGLLSSLAFGDKIDYDQDFRLWVKDQSSLEPTYAKVDINTGISQAELSNFQGNSLNSVQSIYKLTVIEGTQIGDYTVAQVQGSNDVSGETGPGSIQTGTDITTILNNSISEQNITIKGVSSQQEPIKIRKNGGDAIQSAASIAKALNQINGIKAYASETVAVIGGLTGIKTAEYGDNIVFDLVIDNMNYEVNFLLNDLNNGALEEQLEEQFETALLNAGHTLNNLNKDNNLTVNKLTITSNSGKNIGIKNFRIKNNTGVKLSNFTGFDIGDTVKFKVNSNTIPLTSTLISVNLQDIDVTDDTAVLTAFYNALDSTLNDEFFVSIDETDGSISLRTTNESNITLETGIGYNNNASIDLKELDGTSAVSSDTSDEILNFAPESDIKTFESIKTFENTMTFTGPTETIISDDTSGTKNTAAIITGTFTALLDEGISLSSNVYDAGGLFGTSGKPSMGNSIITLGGENGFLNFQSGNTVSFNVDGNFIEYEVNETDDIELAKELEQELINNFSSFPEYKIIRTGKSVSILKDIDLETPISITDFTSSDPTLNTRLAVNTGTGKGTNDPVNDFLESNNSYKNFCVSTLYDQEGIIQWERLNNNGFSTGKRGYVNVSDAEKITITENGEDTISFDIKKGELVAGNTLLLNTDTLGKPDPLNFTIKGSANSVLDTYHFKTISGGKIGHEQLNPEDTPITIQWENSTNSGIFTIKGLDPPITPKAPVEVKVDGMRLKFYDGTLFKDDVFTINTDSSGFSTIKNNDGNFTGKILSNWHWTMDSFVNQFNKESGAVKSSITDNIISFNTSDNYYDIENIKYSNINGFNSGNVQILINNYSGLDFEIEDFKLTRTSGLWKIENDFNAVILPKGGDNDGFSIDLTGNGLSDINIVLTKKITKDGYIEFDLKKKNQDDYGFAFSNNESGNSGITAAFGINTFYSGSNSNNMKTNKILNEPGMLAAAVVNNDTGQISKGDNTNCIDIADLRNKQINMQTWTYTRGNEQTSSFINETIDDYYRTMLGSMGLKLRSVENSEQFYTTMVNQIKQQRDSVSAVSLDEEMINLTKFQHAFQAASKLVTVSDEMLSTLISMR
ncbi:MAG: flagellar hook-associated protein FlgK [Desulfobacteraceae bacterium 4572_130]|nr:MAG: flagellar hook-associated protein FlgK [Desulfobacteraceae bacterium 4572_130]